MYKMKALKRLGILGMLFAALIAIYFILTEKKRFVSPTSKVLVANMSDNTVSVLDASTYKLLAVISVGAMPHQVVCSPDGTKAYTANSGDGSVSFIDVAALKLTTTVIIPYVGAGAATDPDNKGQAEPEHLWVSPDGKLLFAGAAANQEVVQFDAATAAILARVRTSDAPYRGAFTKTRPHGVTVIPGLVFVANRPAKDLSVLSYSAASMTLMGTPFSTGGKPHGIAVTPDAKKLYIPLDNLHAVAVVDISTPAAPALLTTIKAGIGMGPAQVVVLPDGKSAYVINGSTNNVSVIDVAKNTVTTLIPVGLSPAIPAASMDSAFVFVPNYGNNNLSVISAATQKVVNTVSVGKGPHAAAFCAVPTVAGAAHIH